MRVKRGINTKRKHKKLLKAAKGYRATYHTTVKRAHEALLHAGQYSYIHRRHRRGQMRRQWIKIIAAGLVGTGLSYNRFIQGLKKQNIDIDRKILAEIAQANPNHFSAIVEKAN